MKIYISSILFACFSSASVVDLEYFDKFFRLKHAPIDFEFENFRDQIRVKDDNLCWTIQEDKLVFNECTNSPNQLFEQNESGQISLIGDEGKCLNVNFMNPKEFSYDNCASNTPQSRTATEGQGRYYSYGYYYNNQFYATKKEKKAAMKADKKAAKMKVKSEKKKVKSAFNFLWKQMKKCKQDLSTPDCRDPVIAKYEDTFYEEMSIDRVCKWDDFTILGAYRCRGDSFCYRKKKAGAGGWNIGKCKSCYYARMSYPFITCKDLYPIGLYAETKRTAVECIDFCYKSLMSEEKRKELIDDL